MVGLIVGLVLGWVLVVALRLRRVRPGPRQAVLVCDQRSWSVTFEPALSIPPFRVAELVDLDVPAVECAGSVTFRDGHTEALHARLELEIARDPDAILEATCLFGAPRTGLDRFLVPVVLEGLRGIASRIERWEPRADQLLLAELAELRWGLTITRLEVGPALEMPAEAVGPYR